MGRKSTGNQTGGHKTGRTARQGPKPPKKISERYLHNSGLAYLQRFPASSMHFRTVMQRKIDRSLKYHGAPEAADCARWLDALVEKFKDLGLLDDAAYLAGMVRSLRRKGLGKSAIGLKLAQKGYDFAATQEALADIDDELTPQGRESEADLMAALRFLKAKRLGPFAAERQVAAADPDRLARRTLAALARAGYDYGTARQAMDTGEEEAEALLAEMRL